MNDYNVSRTIWDYLKSVSNMDKFGDIPLPKTDHQQNLKAVYRLIPDLWLETFTRQNQDKTSVKKYGKELMTEFKQWVQEQGYRYETNAGKLVMALLTLNIICPRTNKKAICESKHTENGEQREYDISILKTHYKVGCQIIL